MSKKPPIIEREELSQARACRIPVILYLDYLVNFAAVSHGKRCEKQRHTFLHVLWQSAIKNQIRILCSSRAFHIGSVARRI